MACTLVEEDLVDPGRLAEHLNGLERGRAALVRDFTPELVADACGIEAGEIRRMARELAAAAARRRLRAHRHLHAGVRDARQLAGRRAQRADRQPRPRGRRDVPAGGRRAAQRVRHPRRRQGRAHGALAQPRARAARDLRRAAGRRARRGDRDARARARCARSSPSRATRWSRRRTPSGSRAAIESLDFMLAVDIYVNETTRHADVVLPGPEPLEKSHYDLALYQLAVRNVANYSPRVFEPSGPAGVGDLPAAGRRAGGTGPERRPRRARRPGHLDGRPARGRRRRLTRGRARAWPS